MSIPDLADPQELGASMVEEIRLTAERRLRQIQPLIEEAERLRDVLDALERRRPHSKTAAETAISSTQANGKDERSSTRESKGRRPRQTQARNGSAQPRAAKGANKRVIIELVGRSPGITPAEISATTGMKRTVVASTVSRLKRHGELCDYEGGGLCLPSPESLAPVAAEPRNGVSRRSLGGVEERSRRLASLPRRHAA